ncbi:MAG: cell envelope biogenesis protein OmpA [Flavobacteriaceae bacterium]|nr:cell envelope biogenesis protein OmpA [Flavobacteriaceae bacterium]
MELRTEEKLAIIKDLLLAEDREYAMVISERIEELEKIIHERPYLAHKVDPIIQERLESFVHEIPATLGPVITETLKQEIENSRDQVVEALYPIMGKMIKKYIGQEIKMLSEKLSSQLNNTFSVKWWQQKFKASFMGVRQEELILAEAYKPKVEQVFIIEKDSGILLASYTKQETLDKDMISGMLTAIKGFVEDAFQAKGQNLELIEYELYNIHVQSFIKYYVAVVVSGNYNLHFKDKLQDVIFDFSKEFLALPSTAASLNVNELEEKLKIYFEHDL